MLLFMTIEAQHDVCKGGKESLPSILMKVVRKLKFVTDQNKNLENVDNYGTEFREIAIIPTCCDDRFWGDDKERKQIWRKKKEADIRLRMDYDSFKSGSYEVRYLLFVDILIKSIQVVKERSKGDFKGDELIEDILSVVNVTWEQLEELDINKSNK